MLKCPMHASGGRSVRWHEGRVWPTPRPTAHVLRREGIRHRKGQQPDPIEAAVRAQPSRRATPSAVHGAMPLRQSQRLSPRLHTDSSQTRPFSHARATSDECSCAVRSNPRTHRPLAAVPIVCASPDGDRLTRRDYDRSVECRPYERSARRAVSAPLGVGGNRTDRKGRRSLRFAPPTPP